MFTGVVKSRLTDKLVCGINLGWLRSVCCSDLFFTTERTSGCRVVTFAVATYVFVRTDSVRAFGLPVEGPASGHLEFIGLVGLVG
ncbi:hypothetical protein DPMN_157716 [Dreissena polymorpha]|uniref:Uncharacterized protein n=1 Tax=Dreissena polymorpha TaxID=45954 RepID=A0A9D4EGI3_DREPO|nr:hypothetical protein DPMN_157716 [Dreissena polymorpha]